MSAVGSRLETRAVPADLGVKHPSFGVPRTVTFVHPMPNGNGSADVSVVVTDVMYDSVTATTAASGSSGGSTDSGATPKGNKKGRKKK